MVSNSWKRMAGVAALGSLMAASSFADCRKKQDLTPTSQGSLSGASGNVDLRAQGTDQRFKVEVEADVPNRSVYSVQANGLTMGTLRIRLGQGELDIHTKDGGQLPNGLDSVCSVTSVTVTDAKGNVVLTGSF